MADLSLFGTAGYYFYALLIGGALLGAALGWLVGNAGAGTSIGAAVGLVCWLGLVVASFRQLRGYEGRRRERDNGDDDR